MKNFIFLILFLTIVNCNKKEEINYHDSAEDIQDGYNKANFNCIGDSSNLFFRGTFNNSSFCYNDGYDGNFPFSRTRSTTYTTTATLSSSNQPSTIGFIFGVGHLEPFELYKEYFYFETPNTKDISLSWLNVIKMVSSVGEYQVRSDSMNTLQGVNVILEIPYYLPEIGSLRFAIAESASGSQIGSHLIIDDVQSSVNIFGKTQYQLTGRLNCKLYWSKDYALKGKFAGDLENCSFSLLISEP
jgi:hypothetical protein